MTYCPFCGGKLDSNGKCPDCGRNYGTGSDFNAGSTPHCDACGDSSTNGDFTVLALHKVLIVIAMLVIGSGSIIGIIAGAVLLTGKDPKYKAYGKCLLKLGIILLIIKAVVAVILYILYLTIGFSSIFLIFNSFARGLLCATI